MAVAADTDVEPPPAETARRVAVPADPADGSPAVRGFEHWELHSELVLVCPELRTAALAQRPTAPSEPARPSPQRPSRADAVLAVARYTSATLAETLLIGAIAVAVVVLLTLVATLR